MNDQKRASYVRTCCLCELACQIHSSSRQNGKQTESSITPLLGEFKGDQSVPVRFRYCSLGSHSSLPSLRFLCISDLFRHWKFVVGNTEYVWWTEFKETSEKLLTHHISINMPAHPLNPWFDYRLLKPCVICLSTFLFRYRKKHNGNDFTPLEFLL